MNVKVLKIRVAEPYINSDQQALDRFLQQHNVIKFESAFVQDEENYWSVILYYEENKPTVNETDSSTYITETEEELNSDELKILESLKYWRSEKAKDQKLPAYFIATNKELLSIARYRPAKKEELLDIKGFGKHKIENYGEEIIDILDSI